MYIGQMKRYIVQRVVLVRYDVQKQAQTSSVDELTKLQSSLSENMFLGGVPNLLFADHRFFWMWRAERLYLRFELFLQHTRIACGGYESEEGR